jgi:hypothetical protein
MLNAHNEDGEDGAMVAGSTDPEEGKENNKERGKTVKFQSQNDDISNRDSVAIKDNFFNDLQKHNFGEDYDEAGNPKQIRGLTKIG